MAKRVKGRHVKESTRWDILPRLYYSRRLNIALGAAGLAMVVGYAGYTKYESDQGDACLEQANRLDDYAERLQGPKGNSQGRLILQTLERDTACPTDPYPTQPNQTFSLQQLASIGTEFEVVTDESYGNPREAIPWLMVGVSLLSVGILRARSLSNEDVY